MRAQGRTACIIIDVSSDEVRIQENQSESFHMASVIKLILLCCALNEVDHGELDLQERVQLVDLHPMTSSYIGRCLAAGHESLPLGRLIDLMASRNDSEIADYVFSRIGIDKINGFCRDCGMSLTAVTSSILRINAMLFYDDPLLFPQHWSDLEVGLLSHSIRANSDRLSTALKSNLTTPSDIASLILGICRGDILSSKMTDVADRILRKQISKDRIPRLLESRQVSYLAHSIGTVNVTGRFEVVHDVGYYKRSGVALVMVFMNDRVIDLAHVENSIANAARDEIISFEQRHKIVSL